MTTVPMASAASAPGLPGGGSEASRGRVQRLRFILPVLAAAAFGCALIWTASYPGVPFIGIGLVALCTVVLSAAATMLWMSRIQPGRLSRQRMVASIVGLVLLLTSAAFTAAGTPLEMRFAASRAAFEAVVTQADHSSARVTRSDPVEADPVKAGDQNLAAFPIRCPQTAGQFSIAGCEQVDNGGYLFFQKWNALTDSSGIAYLPNGPTPWAFEKPHHLSGPWYVWTCGC